MERRTYEDGCATAHALDLIGDRWALLVVRELILGPKRFTDLRAGLPGISPNVLTQRLEQMEASGILRRRKLAPPAAAWVYELTEWGLGLEKVIIAIGRWAVHSPTLQQGHPLGTDALILSFRTMFNPKEAAKFKATLELRIGEDRFRAVVANREMQLTRGTVDDPDAILEADSNTIASIAYGGRKFAEAMKSGALKVTGDREKAKRFFSLFPLPAPAA